MLHLTNTVKFLALLLLLCSTAIIEHSLAATDIWGEEIDGEPILTEILYISLRDRDEKSDTIHIVAGPQLSDEAGTGFDRITVKPGAEIDSSKQPGDLRINLYRGTGKQRVLVAALHVRFYQSDSDEDAWIPKYLLAQEPVIIRQGNRLIPLETTMGAGNVVLVGNSLPNAEGYYSELTFSQGLGKTFVDSWQLATAR